MVDLTKSHSRKTLPLPRSIPYDGANMSADGDIDTDMSMESDQSDNENPSNNNGNEVRGNDEDGSGPSSYLAKISGLRHKTTTPLLTRSHSNPMAHLSSAHGSTTPLIPTSATLKQKALINSISTPLVNGEIEFYEPLHTNTTANTISTPSSSTNAIITASTTSKPHINPMTVETETVSVIPTLAVGGPAPNATTSSALSSAMPSASTHNPTSNTSNPLPNHNENLPSSASLHSAIMASPLVTDTNSTSSHGKKKRSTKKGSSVHQSIIGKNSKAEIFAAKVASAVGDHHSSDSEETFVYESNPMERINSNTSISTGQMPNRSQNNNGHSHNNSHHTEDSFGGISESNDDYEGPNSTMQSHNYGPFLGNLGQSLGQQGSHARQDSSDTDANSINGYDLGGVGASALLSSIGDGYQTLVGPRRSTRFAKNSNGSNILNVGNGNKTAESVFAMPHPVNKAITPSVAGTAVSAGLIDNSSVNDTTSLYTDHAGPMSSSDDNSSTLSRQHQRQQHPQNAQSQYANRYTKYRLDSVASDGKSTSTEPRPKRYSRKSSQDNTEDHNDSNNLGSQKATNHGYTSNNSMNLSNKLRQGSPRRGYFRDMGLKVSNRNHNNNNSSNHSSTNNTTSRSSSALNLSGRDNSYILTADDIDDDDFDLDDDLDDEELVGYSQIHHSRSSKLRGGLCGGQNDGIYSNRGRTRDPMYELNDHCYPNNHKNNLNNSKQDFRYDSALADSGYGSTLHSDRHGRHKASNGSEVSGSNSNNGKINGIRRVRKSGMLYSPHNYQRGRSTKSRWYHLRVACYMVMVLLMLGVGFVFGFFIASNKSLNAVSILGIEDILVSDDELVFNIEVEARNPGFLPLAITDVDIDIFAKSARVKQGDSDSDDNDSDNEDNDEDKGEHEDLGTILVGNVVKLDIPLVFQGSLMHRNRVHKSIGVVKLVIPEPDHGIPRNQTIPLLKNQQGHEKKKLSTLNPDQLSVTDLPGESDNWRKLNDYPFNMIVRGVLKYDIPIIGLHKVVYISKTVYVDPENI
ncbi:hypothetical protein NADFUDRAFT_66567 [Nadsonia fulvescens var. elongata DSM 6958]|uniref:Vacuolar segregation protein 7 n=1 Tax=Nadsonia fulvescens var. elongata DSM 6958 TaxID=857566 RepID=A0A1E3PGC6_9ASCO|nr:hypothetical protein NADFUDRAFT_66567 [Nadsonia fulvescens var. elongata DSM 6958]